VSALKEKQTETTPTGGMTRLVPGMSGLRAVPQKRPQSVELKAEPGGTPDKASVEIKQSFFRAVTEILIPRPRAAAGQWNLWRAVASDFVLVGLVFVGATHFRVHAYSFLHLNLPEMVKFRTPAECHFFLGFAFLYASLVTLLAYTEGTYQESGLAIHEEVRALAKAVSFATLLTAAATHISSSGSASKASLVCSFVLSLLGLTGSRFWQRHLSSKKLERGQGLRRVLIVGADAHARKLAEYFEHNPHIGRVVKGFVDDDCEYADAVLGRIADIAHIARAEFIDEIILTISHQPDQARRVIQQAREHHLDVRLVPELFGSEAGHPRIEWFERIPMISLHEEPLPQFALSAKRTFDVLLASVALLFLFPVLALIALLIKLDSSGPLIYRALRVGRKGQRFCCYKFRTMVSDADHLKERLRVLNQREGPCFKIAQDPRVTGVGRFLRRYSLDELPQLWNVVRGDMSLVGPRPHPLDDFARYEVDHFARLDVTPGMTGLWQVTARQDPSFRTTLGLDLEYIQKWSLWLDLQILFKTLSVVVTGTGV